ncbi:MAG: amino acid ABC transporter substrate-binding protein [Actinobacteria bacterium]|nr:MAG: amino acid ABC transporter substrate-binding protein [Actinomycetota bacterium]
MRRATRWGILAAALAAVGAIAALAGTTGSHAAPAAKKTVIIGWAFDQAGQMAPFDNPALAAAKIRIKQINAKGKYRFVINTCDTQNNDAAKAKACALSLLGQGAKIIFTTCDVDYATPVVQETINRGKLAIAPCIGTDQMGPRRFGKKGKLAFSFGNVAQDEGSAMAEYAYSRGWKTAGLATNTRLVYFKNVVQAFDIRFRQLGGKIVDRESYATGQNNVQSAVTRLNSHKAAVYVTSTAFGELPAFVSGMRSLHNNTPILNSWAGDGTYWDTQNPKVTNYYCVTFASVFGDDPSAAVRKMIASLTAAGSPPGTGGFLGGADAIDGVYTAIKRAHGSLKGAVLAAQLEHFNHVAVLGSKVSFSKKWHTVFGRQYRVIKTQANKAKRVGLVTAKVLPKIH